MKELRNNVTENVFTDLQEAKDWYLPKKDIDCPEEEYLGDDYEGYCRRFTEYKEEIQEAKTLEELADVLNKYTDTFEDGRWNRVVEF